MAFNLFPYSNFHKLNLDWVIKTVKEAAATLEQAASTVSQYNQRLSALEASVGVLDSALSSLQNTVQAQGQAIADLPQIRTQVNNALTMAANATQAAEDADETASTALTQSQALQTSKMNRVSPEGVSPLRINDPDPTGQAELYLKAGDDLSNDYHLNAITSLGNGVMGVYSAYRDGNTTYAGETIIRGVSDPVLSKDAAPKSYVDTKMPKTNPIGTGTLIMNATTMDDGLVLQDTVMTGVKFKASSGGLSLVSMLAGSEQPSQRVKISGVENPTANNDAATKEYVDNSAALTRTTIATQAAWDAIAPNNAISDLPANSMIFLNSSTVHPVDAPGSLTNAAMYGTIITLGIGGALSVRSPQIIIRQTGQVYVRVYTGASWAQWYKFDGTADPTPSSLAMSPEG